MRTKQHLALLVVLTATTAMVTGCKNRRVTRTSADSTKGGDLSGYWNDIDANLVSTEMIKDCLSRPWAANFKNENDGERPVVKLMGVQKRTDDRNVNTQYFSKRLERELLNSGTVRVVAGWGQDNVNMVERARQAKMASDETAKSHGNEVGADFTLQTIVNSQNETDGGGRSVRAYLVNMELISVETNEKVWIGEKSIRKVVNQRGTSW